MTTLERLAKLAYEKMVTQQNWPAQGRIWETELQELRDNWIASTRTVVEGMLELPEEIQGVVRKSSGYPTGYGMYQAAIRAILEEKP